MKHQLLDFEIISNESNIDGSVHLLRLRADDEMPAIKSGQFVNVEISDSKQTFLRRPISVCLVDGNELWLYVKKAGEGTIHLCDMEPGRKINLLLPLGNGFSIPDGKKRILLIGGGVGVAPLLQLGKELKGKGHEVNYLLGARSEKDLFLMEEFEKYGILYITTEDGSRGEKGFVTQHSVLDGDFDLIQVCGPMPMMKGVAKIAAEKGVECEVSLENKMACGLGACLCCVEDTREGHKCVCSDGPVFNIKELKWI